MRIYHEALIYHQVLIMNRAVEVKSKDPNIRQKGLGSIPLFRYSAIPHLNILPEMASIFSIA